MKRAVAAIALVLTLAACEANAEINVNDNGSGTFGFSFFIDQQFLALIAGFGGSEGGDPFDEFKSGLKDSPVPFQIEEFTKQGGKGIRASVPFKDVGDLRAIMKDLDESEGSSSDSPLGGGSPGFGTFELERRNGGWHFESISEAPDLGDLGDLSGGEAGGEAPFDPSQIASLLKISFRVSLPGRTVTTTADKATAKGGTSTFVWNADLTSKEPMKMVATTTAAGGSISILPIAVGLGALAVIGGALFRMQRRKSAAAAIGVSDQPAGTWPPPPDAPPPAP